MGALRRSMNLIVNIALAEIIGARDINAKSPGGPAKGPGHIVDGVEKMIAAQLSIDAVIDAPVSPGVLRDIDRNRSKLRRRAIQFCQPLTIGFNFRSITAKHLETGFLIFLGPNFDIGLIAVNFVPDIDTEFLFLLASNKAFYAPDGT